MKKIYNKEKAKEYYQANKEKRQAYQREYIRANKEKVKLQKKKYQENNREKIREYNKKYRGKNNEKIKEYYKVYRQVNKEKRKLYHKKSRQKRFKTDLKYRLNTKMRRDIYNALKGNKAGRRWKDLVGYSVKDLINHLKKTMPKGYTWNDYFEGKLHVDHIIPKSVFNYNKAEHTDFKRCWSLKNLRLLPAKENIIKADSLNKPFQPALKI